MASMLAVAVTPVGPLPHNSPAAHLVRRVDVYTGESQVRVLDDRAQRSGADGSGGPLHHPIWPPVGRGVSERGKQWI